MAERTTKRGKTKGPKATSADLTPSVSRVRQVRGGVSKGVINTKALTLPLPADGLARTPREARGPSRPPSWRWQ